MRGPPRDRGYPPWNTRDPTLERYPRGRNQQGSPFPARQSFQHMLPDARRGEGHSDLEPLRRPYNNGNDRQISDPRQGTSSDRPM